MNATVPRQSGPAPVLWLLVPWAGALAYATDLLLAATRHPASADGVGGVLEVFAAFGRLWLSACWEAGLAASWAWLAHAAPGRPQPALWLAVACAAAPWFGAAGASAAAAALELAAAAMVYATLDTALGLRASRQRVGSPPA